MKKIVVVGANFAGTTAALEVKRKLKNKVEVTVIDPTDDILYFPSLIWVPIGRRTVEQVIVPRRPGFEKHGIKFVEDLAVSVDPDKQVVTTEKSGSFKYDQLVIATGPKVHRDAVPGLLEHACYIGSIHGALEMHDKLLELKKNPGPVVIGATQKASCMGAAYEVLFNVDKWLREQHIRDKVEMHWVTPEPYIGHLGIDGLPSAEKTLKKLMKKLDIHYHTECAIKEVTADAVILDTDKKIPSVFKMFMVPFTGVDFITNSPKLQTPENKFLDVLPDYRLKSYKNIWGAGLAVNVAPPTGMGRVPFGAPKTGYPSDMIGKIVAHNIAQTIKGKTKLKEKEWGRIPAVCIMNAGKKEVMFFGSSLFKPRWFAIVIPNMFNDFGKLALEKYFLLKLRHGWAWMP